MAVLTSNGKRRQHWLTLNHNHSSPIYSVGLKRLKVSTMSHNHTPSVISSNSAVSRISRYPEHKPLLHREVHAPCRPHKFDFSTFKPSVYHNDSILQQNYQLAKNSALATIRLLGDGNEVVEVDTDTHRVAVSDDSSVEEVHFIEEDAQEVRSIVTNHKWQKSDLVVTEIKDSDAKFRHDGLKQQSTSSAVSELTNSDLNVVDAAQMLDTLALTPERGPSSVQAYKKLLENVGKRTDTINKIEVEIELNEKRRSSLHQKKEQEVPWEAFAPLTREEEVEVVRAFSAKRKVVLVNHEKSNIEISGEKFRCLRPGAWLNDEVINLYLELLKERERREPQKFLKCHFFNTFFYKRLISGKNGYDFKSVRRWTSQKKLGYGLLECDKIFVPIHQEIHWCLAVINTKDKKFQYLDSLKGMDTRVLKVLTRYFVDEVKDKTGQGINISSWEKEYVEDLPVQENGSDCGMFMIKYADFYCRNLGLCFSQDHMPYFRFKTAKEILRLKAD